MIHDNLKKEFFNRFTMRNPASKNGCWWNIPAGGDMEFASPIEIWDWIEKRLLKDKPTDRR